MTLQSNIYNLTILIKLYAHHISINDHAFYNYILILLFMNVVFIIYDIILKLTLNNKHMFVFNKNCSCVLFILKKNTCITNFKIINIIS